MVVVMDKKKMMRKAEEKKLGRETLFTRHMSLSVPIRCSTLRRGDHVVIRGRPCKVVELTSSKPGKHGHAKINFIGIDLFTGKKIEHSCPSTANVEIPYVTRTEYTLVNIEDAFLSLMDTDGKTKEDLALPQNVLGKKIQMGFAEGKELTVVVLSSMGEEACIECR